MITISYRRKKVLDFKLKPWYTKFNKGESQGRVTLIGIKDWQGSVL